MSWLAWYCVLAPLGAVGLYFLFPKIFTDGARLTAEGNALPKEVGPWDFAGDGLRQRRLARLRELAPTAGLPRRSAVEPFVSQAFALTPYERVKMAVVGVTVFPVRLFVLLSSLLLTAMAGMISNAGLSTDELKKPNRSPWRRFFRHAVGVGMRTFLWGMGITWVTEEGHIARPEEAGIIVGNHISLVEAIFLTGRARGSAVSRAENFFIPIAGSILWATQSLYVDRNDPESRNLTAAEIKRRALSNGEWPHLILFPESTTTNGRAVIDFKPGAFNPGAPVQPVAIRYNFRHLDGAFVDTGPDMGELILRLMLQVYNTFHVTYLPVYRPSEQERANPMLFANNVRKLIATRLGIPCTEHSFDDVHLSMLAKKLKCHPQSGIVEATAFRTFCPGADISLLTDALQRFALLHQDRNVRGKKKGFLTLEEFADAFAVGAAEHLDDPVLAPPASGGPTSASASAASSPPPLLTRSTSSTSVAVTLAHERLAVLANAARNLFSLFAHAEPQNAGLGSSGDRSRFPRVMLARHYAAFVAAARGCGHGGAREKDDILVAALARDDPERPGEVGVYPRDLAALLLLPPRFLEFAGTEAGADAELTSAQAALLRAVRADGNRFWRVNVAQNHLSGEEAHGPLATAIRAVLF